MTPGDCFEPGHVDLQIEVADVADDRVVRHLRHVLAGDDVAAAGGGDEDVALRGGVFHRGDFVAFHRRLQGADRVDLGDEHPGAEAPHRVGTALADVAVAADHDHLAGDHDVGRPLDAVGQRLAAAVEVVELALGDRVVDVDRRHLQLAALVHLVEAVDAGGRLLRQAADAGAAGRGTCRGPWRSGRRRRRGSGSAAGRRGRTASARCTSRTPRRSRPSRRRPGRRLAAMAAAAWSWVEKMLQLLQVTSAPSSASVSISTAVWIVMCRQPAMRAPVSGLRAAVLLAQGHQAGHFVLGQLDLLAAPIGQAIELGGRTIEHFVRQSS